MMVVVFLCSMHPRRFAIVAAMMLSAGALLQAQSHQAYVLYNSSGHRTHFKKMMHRLKGADVILFGEFHDNAIAHWLQLEVARALADAGPLVLGAEMVERDDQATLDSYLHGAIDQAAFDTLARLWKNHTSDYKPLVDLAKERHFPFVASNVPRRYARAVSRGGFEALDTVPAAERQWIAPLPIPFDPELPRYRHMLSMMGDHGTPDVVKAQALKDATMAHSIARNFRQGSRFIHFNGSFHSDFFEGINWYLEHYAPQLKRITISTVTQADAGRLESGHKGQADFILVVDEDIPGTY